VYENIGNHKIHKVSQFNKEKLGKYLIKYDFWKNLILQQFNGKNKLVQSYIYKIYFLVGCLLYYIHFVEIFYLNYESRLFVRNANCENIQNVIFEPLCIFIIDKSSILGSKRL